VSAVRLRGRSGRQPAPVLHCAAQSKLPCGLHAIFALQGAFCLRAASHRTAAVAMRAGGLRRSIGSSSR
jgi:hypothetical protein